MMQAAKELSAGQCRIRIGRYKEVIRINLKAQMAWRADVIFQMVFTVTKILFAYLLWGIIFRENQVVAGFTFHGMLSYYIISAFLSQLDLSGGISEEITQRIRGGTFSKYIVLPVSIEGYFIAMEVGVVLFYLGFDLIAALVWVFVFRIQFVFTQSLFLIICALVMVLLGLFFMVQFNYFLGILTLKYEEISTFLMIKNNLIALVTGSIVPLALFPGKVVACMKLLPFYYVTYLPAMLLTGRCADEAVTGIIVLACWCLLMQGMIGVTWKKYRIKYDGVGI
ncbi:MAG: ABC-2 family transporter protein [Bacillota bacterium]|nr:ABC-2 family transporter protein [Bacillota bacterium]